MRGSKTRNFTKSGGLVWPPKLQIIVAQPIMGKDARTMQSQKLSARYVPPSVLVEVEFTFTYARATKLIDGQASQEMLY